MIILYGIVKWFPYSITENIYFAYYPNWVYRNNGYDDKVLVVIRKSI